MLYIVAPFADSSVVGMNMLRLLNGRIDSCCRVSDDLRPLVAQRPAGAWKMVVYPQAHHFPDGLHPRFPVTVDERTIVFVGWDSTHIGDGLVDLLKNAALVMVPSAWNQNTMKRHGIDVVKVPLGCDLFEPPPLPDICTFGASGTMYDGPFRDNLKGVAMTFQAAFTTEDVRLKIAAPLGLDGILDLEQKMDERIEIVKTLPNCTAYVNMSFGTGFSLDMLQWMACGRPAISHVFGGIAEVFDEKVGYVAGHFEMPCPEAFHGPYEGTWAVPDLESFAVQMRSVHGDQERARRMGQMARHRAREFTWERFGERLRWHIRKVAG